MPHSAAQAKSHTPAMMHDKFNISSIKKAMPIFMVLALGGVAFLIWQSLQPVGPGPNFVRGNGRLEAITIDIATKAPGRIEQVFVKDGDYVQAGQALVQMQSNILQAQRDEIQARHQQATHAVASARAHVAGRLSDLAAAEATVLMRESELEAALKRLARTTTLASEGAASRQEQDDDRARTKSVQAAVQASRAQVEAARAGVTVSQAQVVGAISEVNAIQASLNRIDADLTDTVLIAPRAARVQFIIAQPGEVTGAGGKILNLVDLQDVYMTFFLPESAAGKAAIGADVRIILDANPDQPIPARISFVASTAQFTPKTVETASERQKFMFRVKAQLEKDFVERNLSVIKTGIPGVAWVRLDASAAWPANLTPGK